MNARPYPLSIDRHVVSLVAAAMLLGASPTYGQNGSVGVAYPATGIKIDGDLSDWPKNATTYPAARVEHGDKLAGKDDLSAQFRVAYNVAEHALYVAVEVSDDSIVLDGPGVARWDAQDGCEVYVDAAHASSASPVVQYVRYGNQSRFIGPPGATEQTVKVAVARTETRIIYEWLIDLGGELVDDRVIGFDISVADKDKDGSFSWLAWGPGTQKGDTPDRCGEFILVRPETKFGEVSGTVAWKDPSEAILPSRVRIKSTRSAPLWRGAIVDPSGTYKATKLPLGSYSIHAVDSSDNRVDVKPHVDVEITADAPAKAKLLQVTPIPWPGLIGDEGVLRTAGTFDAESLDRVLKAYLDYYRIPGMSVAVIKDSKVVYHRGLGVKNTLTQESVTDDTVFEAASMTKPVCAYIVLRLVDRGVLKLDTPLYTYLPYEDIAYDDRYKLITARMVLTHRSGFPNWRNGKLDIKFTPGTQFSYSGEGFVYLGKVVEKLTGKKLVQLCQEEVFEPLGIEHASLVWTEEMAKLTATGHGATSPMVKGRPSQPNMAASLHVDAKNYAKFLIAYVQGKGLAEATARDMLRSQGAIPDEPKSSFGLGVAIEDTPHGIHYGHGGRNTGFTSLSLMYKDLGMGYVFLVNNDDASKVANILNAYLITGKSGLKNTRTIAHKLAKIDPKIYDEYVGRYKVDYETIVTVTREGDKLMAQPSGDAGFELFPESETVFLLKPTTDATATFVKDTNGRISHIVLTRDGRKTEAKRLEGELKPAVAGGKGRVPTIDELLTIKTVAWSGVALSPDGKWVAYLVRQADFKADAFINHIWIVEASTGRNYQLTRGEKSVGGMAWSSDSRWLAFTSDRGVDKNQIFAIPPDGGEAVQLTKVETGVNKLEWSPDGKTIAFTASPSKKEVTKQRNEHLGDFQVVRREYDYSHLWTIDVGEALKAPQTGKQHTKGREYSIGGFSWSPDASKIAFDASINPDLIQGGTADIYVLKLGDDAVKKIVAQPGPDSNPRWSPDGKQIAFRSAMGKLDFFHSNARIAMVPADGGRPRSVTDEFDESPALIDWKPDGIYFIGSQKTASHLFRVDAASAKITRITGPNSLMAADFSLTHDGRRMAYSAGSPTSLSEVFIADVSSFAPRKLTDLTDQTRSFTLGQPEVISWKSHDGTMIEGVLEKPADFDPSQKRPLLCIIHGGPAGIDRPTLLADGYYSADIWTGRGALVLRVNYRGSAGYGEKFRKLNVRNLGVGDAWDVLSGVDHLIKLGYVDPTKVGCMGWSQGGYISAFLTASSDRFKAISVGAGISDWATYYYNTDITPFTIQYLGMDPIADPAIYQKTSPMSYIQTAKTPTLIQHGENDRRVPIANAYELRQGLEDRGVKVEMVVYKGHGHGIMKPRSVRAVAQHNLAWFNHYIWNDPLPDFANPDVPKKEKSTDGSSQ